MQSQIHPKKKKKSIVPVACGQLSRGLYARIFRRCDVVLWTHFSAITQMIRQLVVFHINTSATQQTNFNSLWVRGESELTARVFGDPAPSARTLPVRILFLLTERPRRPHWEQYCHDSETERSSFARVAHRQHIFVLLKPALRFFRNCESIDRLTYLPRRHERRFHSSRISLRPLPLPHFINFSTQITVITLIFNNGDCGR